MRISDWSSDVCSSDLDQHGNTEPSDDLPPYTGYHKMPVQIMKHTHQPRRTWRLVKHLRIGGVQPQRSEEHTSELQSLMRISYAVFCLKKKTKNMTRKHK